MKRWNGSTATIDGSRDRLVQFGKFVLGFRRFCGKLAARCAVFEACDNAGWAHAGLTSRGLGPCGANFNSLLYNLTSAYFAARAPFREGDRRRFV
jgi:hypothetical protein